jgi:hypothetical protein
VDPPYVRLIFKLKVKPKLKLVVTGLENSTSSKIGLQFENQPRKRGDQA